MQLGCLWRALWLVAMVVIAATALPGRGLAQESAPPPPISAAEIERLIGTIENPEERQKFIDQLRALVNAQNAVSPPPPAVPERVATRFLEMLSLQVSTASDAMVRAAAFVSDAPMLFHWLGEEFGDPDNRARLLEIFLKIVVVLLAGWGAEYLSRRLLAPPRRWTEARVVDGRWARIPYALLHTVLMAVPIVIFAVVAFAVLAAVEPRRVTRLMALALINSNLIARAVILLVNLVLMPRVPRLRSVPLSDETAAYLYVWWRRLTNIVVYGYFATEAALLLGIPAAGHTFLLKLLGLVVALLLVILVLQNRAAVGQAIAGRATGAAPDAAPRGARRFLAEYWHVPAILYIVAVFAVWVVPPNEGFVFVLRATLATVIAIIAARLVAGLAIRGMAVIFRVTEDIRQRFPVLELRANRYLQIFNVIVTAAVYAFAALAVLQAWGFGSLEWMATPTGRRVVTSTVSLALTIFVALALWEGLNAALERYAQQTLALGRRGQRGRTLVTLAQRVLSIFIVVLVGLVFLSEIGVNIAPLIAGAGIIGIAVGLGAQTLVKNLIEGVAHLVEDTFAVGDVVKVGDLGGVIEEITMRVLRLRDFSGHVHTIPFSEIRTVTNMTRDFAFAVLDLRVSYRSDVDRVLEIVKREADELRKDPTVGPAIVADVELVGVDALRENEVIVKVRLKVQPPIQQWSVMRAFNKRIKAAFEAEGIEIPFPQRTVHVVGEPKGLAAPGAAAQAASD